MQDGNGDPLASVVPVAVRSAAAQVADQIVLAVRERRLQAKDKLPAERELAQRFSVSRPTIREAVAALELAGVVRSYRGKGTIVIGTPAQVATWGIEILPPQVFEARLVIEPQLAGLAAQKRYSDDMEQLRAALTSLEEEFAETGKYAPVSDLSVHRAIARAARNPILERALEDALINTENVLWADLRHHALIPYETRSGHVDEARQVVQYIQKGDSEQAAAVWRQHLVFFRDEMVRRKP